MNPDIYKVVTPFGIVAIDFPEDGGCSMVGPADGIEHLKAVMSRCVNGQGVSVTEGNLEPRDLVEFCQPPGSLVAVFPPLADPAEPTPSGVGTEAIMYAAENPALARARGAAAASHRARRSRGADPRGLRGSRSRRR